MDSLLFDEAELTGDQRQTFLNEYQSFLKRKVEVVSPSGFDVSLDEISHHAFDWQKHCIRWACRRGRCALFLDTGLGKTLHQLEWSRLVHERTGKPVLIVAPLAVSSQTEQEGRKFDIHDNIKVCTSGRDVVDGLNITNYEKLAKFDCSIFGGVVIDESSIVKSFEGKIRNQLCGLFKDTQYKLACTATPSPNDYMELGNHSEFLSAMSRTEMLSTYFVHDSGDTSKWRLKRHATHDFWHWVSSWALMIRSPVDLGYPAGGYDLPGLDVEVVSITWEGDEAITMSQQRSVRKASVEARVEKIKQIITDDEPWLIWCDRNDESTLAANAILDAVEVAGSMKPEIKAERMLGFSSGKYRVLVTKPQIAGFGMNWQHCNKMIFNGLSHSFEKFYQAVRRCYRFGQTKPVKVYIVITDREQSIIDNVMRKHADLESMSEHMVHHMQHRIQQDIFGVEPNNVSYDPTYEMEFLCL